MGYANSASVHLNTRWAVRARGHAFVIYLFVLEGVNVNYEKSIGSGSNVQETIDVVTKTCGVKWVKTEVLEPEHTPGPANL